MRSAAKAIGGYYPTPDRVAVLLSRCLTVGRGSGDLRVFDPCCGTGRALHDVTQRLPASRVGVEINAERAHEARTLLDRVLQADVFKIRCTHGAFSLLLLNPPYDEDGSGTRQELTFLKHTLPYLASGGVLLYLIPLSRLLEGKICQLLVTWCTDLRVYRFPDPEYAVFKQGIVLGIKNTRGQRNPTAAGVLARLVMRAQPLAEAALPSYPVPRLARKWELASLDMTPAVAQETVRRHSPLWETPEARFYFAERVPPSCRPLLPPRKAHVATLAAAGLLNNAVIDGPQGKRVLKGSVRKTFRKDRERSGEDKTVEREHLVMTIKVVDAQGDITTLT